MQAAKAVATGSAKRLTATTALEIRSVCDRCVVIRCCAAARHGTAALSGSRLLSTAGAEGGDSEAEEERLQGSGGEELLRDLNPEEVHWTLAFTVGFRCYRTHEYEYEYRYPFSVSSVDEERTARRYFRLLSTCRRHSETVKSRSTRLSALVASFRLLFSDFCCVACCVVWVSGKSLG